MDSLVNLADLFVQKRNTWISVIGGGGKTSVMQSLARSFNARGKSVLMTTTTKIQSPQVYSWDADYIFTNKKEILNFVSSKAVSVLYAEQSPDVQKLTVPDSDTLETLRQRFDVVICEADGSRHLPIKIHSNRDPVIPKWNDFTLCLVGAWAFGKSVSENVFGIENIENSAFLNGIIDKQFIDYYLSSCQGLFKNTNAKNRAVIITGTDRSDKNLLNYFVAKSKLMCSGVIKWNLKNN